MNHHTRPHVLGPSKTMNPMKPQPIRETLRNTFGTVGDMLFVAALFIVAALILCLPSRARGADFPSGSDLSRVTTGGIVRLERGGAYRGTLNLRSGTTVTDFGDPDRPRPRLFPSNGSNGVQADGQSNIVIENIELASVPTGSAAGVRLTNVANILVRNCYIHGFNKGLAIEGYNGKRCTNVRIDGNWIANNVRTVAHGAGAYFDKTDGLVVVGNLFDTNGWVPGSVRSDIFSHGLYVQSYCGPSEVRDNVFYNNASHGLQQRSGGTCTGNVFLDNPIGMSFGRVNGAPVFVGGVTGLISNNVYCGGRDIAGLPRGWGLELGQIRDVTVSDCIFAGDNQRNEAAIVVGKCANLVNPQDYIGVKSLKFVGLKWWDWPKGILRVEVGSPNTDGIGGESARQPDLRAILSKTWLDVARGNPNTAARIAIAGIRSTLGATPAPEPGPGTPPPADPPPVVTPPPPVLGETLADALAKGPPDSIRALADGTLELRWLRQSPKPDVIGVARQK